MPRSPEINTLQPRTVLLAADSKHSVIAELAGSAPNAIAYTAYGQQSAQRPVMTGLAFNGEIRETHIGWYLLGNGYRAYNPALMRFHSPDSLSPFGKGGLNAYMYCGGEPVGFSDPTGRVRFFKLLTSSSSRVTRVTSTSSLSPLVSNTAQVASPGSSGTTMSRNLSGGIANPGFLDNAPIYKTLPSVTREVQTKAESTTRHFIDYGPWREQPLSVPSKQKPRFNDSGGHVEWSRNNSAQTSDVAEAWRSKPFLFSDPRAPLPPTRTSKNGADLHYRVSYDANGNPRQSSVEKISLSKVQGSVRKP